MEACADGAASRSKAMALPRKAAGGKRGVKRSREKPEVSEEARGGKAGAGRGSAGGEAPARALPAAPAAQLAEAPPGAATSPAEVPPAGSRRWGEGLCVSGSGLDAAGKAALEALRRASGCQVAAKWSPRVTHVVAACDAEQRAKRTFKYLAAVLHGRWIVSTTWVRESLRAGAAADEQAYEAAGDTQGGGGGPSKGRAHCTQRQPPLLRGWELYLEGEYDALPKEDIKALVQAAGGRILHRPPLAQPKLVPGSGRASKATEAQVKVARLVQSPPNAVPVVPAASKENEDPEAVPVISHQWLLDSASTCQVKPLSSYRIR